MLTIMVNTHATEREYSELNPNRTVLQFIRWAKLQHPDWTSMVVTFTHDVTVE